MILLNTYCLHQNLPSHRTSENFAHLAPFLSIVSKKDLFPLWMSLPSTFPRKKHSPDHTPPFVIFPQSRLPLLPQCHLCVQVTFIPVFKFMTNIRFMFLKPLGCFIQLESLFLLPQTLLTLNKLLNFLPDSLHHHHYFQFFPFFYFFIISIPSIINLRILSQELL